MGSLVPLQVLVVTGATGIASGWEHGIACVGESTTPPVFDSTETVLDDHDALDPATLDWPASGHSDRRTAAQLAAQANTVARFDHLGRARTYPVATASTGPVARAVPITGADGLVPESLVERSFARHFLLMGG